MSRTSAVREGWRPQSKLDRDAVMAELHEILTSPHFCNSKRYPALLQYIVEKTLAGESDLLKERTLGIEVFDRLPSYDTNADTVVRYTAGEVRKRLSLYYHELNRKPAIQITLPAGSYVPEFLHEPDEAPTPEEASGLATHHPGTAPFADAAGHVLETGHHSPDDFIEYAGVTSRAELQPAAPRIAVRPKTDRNPWRVWVVGAAIILTVGAGWRYRTLPSRTPIEQFWAPVLHDQPTMMMCIGGSVFSQTHISGVATATKDVDYPFISIQSAAAAAQISALLERSGGVATQLRSAATTPLTELREHPVIMLGGYNNQWTIRLVQPLRFHFVDISAGEWIIDSAHPEMHWERDPNLPYSGADDYALVARFHDPTTDSWVVALAGIGRNGTEAAAQFAASPHYMQLLRDKIGSDFANRNVEAVIKVSVIEGKTGAPSILTWYAW